MQPDMIKLSPVIQVRPGPDPIKNSVKFYSTLEFIRGAEIFFVTDLIGRIPAKN